MTRIFRFMAARLKRLLYARLSLSTIRIGQVMAGLSLLGVLGSGFLFGAAVMFFRLPPSDFLNKAFAGAKGWNERGQSSISLLPSTAAQEQEGVGVDQADKTADGFTLYTTTSGSRANLIDMRGTVVHHWELPFSRAWLSRSPIQDPLPDEMIHWFRCYLYPNGDLLAIYHADGDTPYGYGLVKLDKDSKLLWSYAGHAHHDVDVGEDGAIYTLTQKLISEPPPSLEALHTPYLGNSLVVLSPKGGEVENIPLLAAFANSPYALALTSSGKSSERTNLFGLNGVPPGVRSLPPPDPPTDDLLHPNSVKVLSRALAPKFPLFRAGQVLLSLRNLNTIAIVDRSTRRVAWAAQGVWRIQHDATFLDNGHLLMYDNAGSSAQTRILEYDPLTQAIPWAYANENSMSFRSLFRGMSQRLSNGNTLLVDPDRRRLLEVTPSKELVWEHVCPLRPALQVQPGKDHKVCSVRRYRADELTFLKGVARVRP